jgi:sporulation protein YlmC with PRC-barrel domain
MVRQQETMIDASALEGKPVYSTAGTEVGQVATVFFDKETRVPEWLALRRGLLGGKHVLVPFADAAVTDDRIAVPYSQSQIESAPETEGTEISESTERALASHYGVAYSKKRSATGLAEGKQSRTRVSPGATSGTRSTGALPTGRGRSRTESETRTRAELYAEAKRLGIEGRSKMNKRELARAVEKEHGARAARAGKANPVEVQAFLAAVDYPVRKRDLIATAKRQKAPAEVRATLERIRDEKFDDAADVSEAIGRLS